VYVGGTLDAAIDALRAGTLPVTDGPLGRGVYVQLTEDAAIDVAERAAFLDDDGTARAGVVAVEAAVPRVREAAEDEMMVSDWRDSYDACAKGDTLCVADRAACRVVGIAEVPTTHKRRATVDLDVLDDDYDDDDDDVGERRQRVVVVEDARDHSSGTPRIQIDEGPGPQNLPCFDVATLFCFGSAPDAAAASRGPPLATPDVDDVSDADDDVGSPLTTPVRPSISDALRASLSFGTACYQPPDEDEEY